MYQVRRVCIEFGRRLVAAGVLDKPEDVFYLTLDEVRETASNLPRLDQRDLISARRGEMEHFRSITPLPMLGTPPPASSEHDSLGRAWRTFAGTLAPASNGTSVLRGTAGSPGIVRGPARVARSLREAGKVQQGEILVVETATPSWTPLFVAAAAVVTDTGGILSHCAVVAREYRIPAVVGTNTGTAVIQDSQRLEVDGDSGVVRIGVEVGISAT